MDANVSDSSLEITEITSSEGFAELKILATELKQIDQQVADHMKEFVAKLRELESEHGKQLMAWHKATKSAVLRKMKQLKVDTQELQQLEEAIAHAEEVSRLI